MNRRRDRLHEVVRVAGALGEDRAAMLTDPTPKQLIFEEITLMQTKTLPAASAGPAARVRLAAIAAAIAVAGLAAFVLPRVFGVADRPAEVAAVPSRSVAAPTGEVLPSSGMCVEEYSASTLAHRGFAFLGTVTGIGKQPDAGEMADPSLPVEFTVHRWFRGGKGQQVTVAMLPPDVVTSAGKTPYEVGSRLLVAGEPRGAGEHPDELLAWACGFTRWADAGAEADWVKAFG
ncbi:MAG TPA: hypothetical protein VF163_09345 [Micromonosporaceae bacterium]